MKKFRAWSELRFLYCGLAGALVVASLVSAWLCFGIVDGGVLVDEDAAQFICVCAIGIVSLIVAAFLVGSTRFTYVCGETGLAARMGIFTRLVPWGEVDVTGGGRLGFAGVSVPNVNRTGRVFLTLPKEREEFLNLIKSYGVFG